MDLGGTPGLLGATGELVGARDGRDSAGSWPTVAHGVAYVSGVIHGADGVHMHLYTFTRVAGSNSISE